MKEIKFTDENYIRHLEMSPSTIVTFRDELKCLEGEIVSIRGEEWCCVEVYDQSEHTPKSTCNIFYNVCGFDTAEDFLREICKLYGKFPTKGWVHELRKL